MGKMSIDRSQSTSVDVFLRNEMARGNRALRSLAPVIGHLLDSEGPSLVSDAIVARLRGMLQHIGRQALESVGNEAEHAQHVQSAFVDHLSADEVLVEHLYVVALEGLLTENLQKRAAIDPILSPLMQELIASERPEIAEVAMTAMASQSRFCQNQSRMELPLGELPSELFGSVLAQFESVDLGLNSESVHSAIAKLKSGFDEGYGRISLFTHLANLMQGGAVAALDLGHAGLALFSSAAATLTRQVRPHIVFACHEGQAARLALILKAAGLNSGAVEGQLAFLGSTMALPIDLETMSQAEAQSLLRELSGV